MATLSLTLLLGALPLAASDPLGQLARGYQSFAAGDYQKAARTLDGLHRRVPRVRDYALYFQAESEFFAGRLASARALFVELSGDTESRFAEIAPWRVADCLWMEGRKSEAAESYRRLLAKPPSTVDVVVARFRVAEVADPAVAGPLFRQIHAEHPAHPLAAEAARRVEPEAPPDQAVGTDPRTRLQRAARLVAGRRFEDAVAELEALPADLPAGLREERDLELGMAKFRTRHAYPEAAALLSAVAPRLQGEKAALAVFQAARAHLRAGRPDEAIAGVRQVVERHAGSRLAPEAQFLVGWLEFNRGAYAQALPGLQTTIDRHRRTKFGENAAWYLALSHHFLGHPEPALAALDEYAGLAGADAEATRRVAYWRGRFLVAKGSIEEGMTLWRGLVKDEPFSYYGLLAAARLRDRGQKVRLDLPRADLKLTPIARKTAADPALLRADELARAGLTVEAGVELLRSEAGLEQRLGRDQAFTVLLDRYPRYEGFRRAFQLAAGRGATALRSAPSAGARTIWEAAYPRGYRALVEKEAKRARVPSLFVYSIMHKESEFGPTRSSWVDARGLLQLMPTLGQEMAAKLRLPFLPEDLFRPEVNIRLGTRRLGELSALLQGQLFLVAGAYIGGTIAVERWLEKHGDRPLDEFLELVGARESREYMKLVTGIHARYVYLYGGGKASELQLAIKPLKRPPAARLPVKPATAPRRASEPAAEQATPIDSPDDL
jgi:soluble lytic murein transglycosylase-like protein/predicted negative regulator of RcsB-dependent stress response